MDLQQLICELESLNEIYKPKIKKFKINEDLNKIIINKFNKLSFYRHTNKLFLTYDDKPYCILRKKKEK